MNRQNQIEEEVHNRQNKPKPLARAAILLGAILFLAALSFTAVRLLKNSKPAQNTPLAVNDFPQQESIEEDQSTQETPLVADDSNQQESIEDTLSQLVREWNDAHSLSNADKFIELYDSTAIFYGELLTKDEIYSKKLSALQKAKDFKQKIVGKIDVQRRYSYEYRCYFLKRVTVNQKTKDYPSYLFFSNWFTDNKQWKITNEGDDITNENLAKREKRGIKEICNLPEVQALGTFSLMEGEEDEEGYSVRVFLDGEDFITTIYWFYVYKNPHKVMYATFGENPYNPDSSLMTIAQWRKMRKENKGY